MIFILLFSFSPRRLGPTFLLDWGRGPMSEKSRQKGPYPKKNQENYNSLNAQTENFLILHMADAFFFFDKLCLIVEIGIKRTMKYFSQIEYLLLKFKLAIFPFYYIKKYNQFEPAIQ